MKKAVFFLLSAGIIATRIFDYIATRDFRERHARGANLLPQGEGFTFVLFLITLYIIYALYVSYFKRIDLFPRQKGLKFREFVPWAYLGRRDKWRAVFWKIPASFSRFNSFFGPILAWSLLWAGLVTTAMWLLINKTSWYYPTYHNPLIIYLIMVAGVVVVAAVHFRVLYLQYKRGSAKAKP